MSSSRANCAPTFAELELALGSVLEDLRLGLNLTTDHVESVACEQTIDAFERYAAELRRMSGAGR